MKRILLSLLLASIILTVSTLSGMAIFGMQHGMTTDGDSCGSAPCITTATHPASSEADCLNHCLSTASSSTTAVAPSVLALTLLAITFIVHASSPHAPTSSFPHSPFFRLRESIGKLLLHRHLSTVILRD